MEKLFNIKENLPVEYEDFRASTQNDAIQRIQFDLANGIDLNKISSVQDFFANEFANFTMNINFERDNVTIQIQ